MLDLVNLGYQLKNRWLLRGLSCQMPAGQLIAVIGPNGAGKSTLLKLISNELKPTVGQIMLQGTKLSEYSPLDLAKRRAYLAQKRNVQFPFTVFQIVLMGRFPHLQNAKESPADRNLAHQALNSVDSDHLADRIYTSLSGGESSRVDMARTLVQEADLILLDEPTNHLDPRHQVEILALCKKLTQQGKTVITALHDLNLTTQYADHVIMLCQGEVFDSGPPEQVMTPEQLQQVYHIDFETWKRSDGRFYIAPKGT